MSYSKMQKIFPRFMCVVGMSIVSSCSLLPEHNASIDRFVLDALAREDVKVKHTQKILVVDQPAIYAPLDSTRIAIKTTPQTIDYIADIEWAERLPLLIHESVIQSLQNAGIFSAVGRLNGGLKSDYLLTLDVRSFEKQCCDNTAETGYFVHLFDAHTKEPLGSKLFTTKVSLAHKNGKEVPASLNRAHHDTTKEMIIWLQNKVKKPLRAKNSDIRAWSP